MFSLAILLAAFVNVETGSCAFSISTSEDSSSTLDAAEISFCRVLPVATSPPSMPINI